MNPTTPETKVAAEGTPRMSRDTLSITDNRTGKAYEIPIKDDTIRAIARLRGKSPVSVTRVIMRHKAIAHEG